MRLPVLAALAAALFAGLLFFYARFVAPERIIVTRVRLRNPALSRAMAGTSAVFLSDLHLGRGREREMGEVLRLLGEIRPDIIFLAGDYVQWEKDPRAYDMASAFFRRLDARLGVYAVMGDADYTLPRKSCGFCHRKDYSPRPLGKVVFLRNSGRVVTTATGRLLVFGLDIGIDEPEGEVAARQRQWIRDRLPPGLPAIILSHSSVAFSSLGGDRDLLMLSGDTHGGQILLPGFVWRLTRRKPDPEHMYGLFEQGRKSLYVTSGVGTSWPHLRLGVPPEIVVLEWGSGND